MSGSKEHKFVDRMGILFEASGAPRTLGRVYGYLLICDPPEQSAAALCDALDVSKGGMSTTLRQLEQAQLVERVHVRGERSTYFRVTDEWELIFKARERTTADFRELAEEGLAAIAESAPERKRRLEAFHHFYQYLEREMHELFARYRKEER